MTQVSRKLFKAVFIPASAFLIILVGVRVALLHGLPWWMVLFILFSSLAGIIFVKTILQRYQEQNFLQKVMDLYDSFPETTNDGENENTVEFRDLLTKVMQEIRKFQQKKPGNPLSLLPCYLIIGESDSGKTTAIKNAGLTPLFPELNLNSGIPLTKNCRWWFFEEAIILDAKGKFVVLKGKKPYNLEWQKLFSLLTIFRKKDPINGLVVTVAADRLINPQMEILENDGRKIRRQIDELIGVLGSTFPIYLMVSKCDLIQGMTQFWSNFTDQKLEQAMGVLNQDMTRNAITFHEQAFQKIADRLKYLRLLIFQRSNSKIAPELLLFPDEFERINPGLDRFIRAIFHDDYLQNTPILRGIFFSSGHQEGTPYSHFMNSMGFTQDKETLPGTNNNLFLKDFFSRILPNDTALSAPTQKAVEWNRWPRNLGLTSWIAITFTVCGLLSISFAKNLEAIRYAAGDFTSPPVLQGEISSDLATMDHFRQAILNIELRNHTWWIPRLMLTESLTIEKKIKEKYCSTFKNVFLVSFDKQMLELLSGFDGITQDEEIGQHAAHLVYRINLLKARLEDENLEVPVKKLQLSYKTDRASEKQPFIPELYENFYTTYSHYLIWLDDTSQLKNEIDTLQSWLKSLLDLRPNEMQWLVAWINQNPMISDIFLQDFWIGPPHKTSNYPTTFKNSADKKEKKIAADTGATIRRAYTSKGKEMIESFIGEMEKALPNPNLLSTRKAEFEQWYRESYFNEWLAFGEYFSNGVGLLDGKLQWQKMASIMDTDNSPFFELLETMAEELKPICTQHCQDLPPWADLVFKFHMIGENMDSETTTRTSEPTQSMMIAAEAYEQYKNALQEILPIVTSSDLAFQMTGITFGEDPVGNTSPFIKAQDAVQNMKKALENSETESSMVWELIKGPWEFLWEYAIQETSCHIEDLWKKYVFEDFQDISDINLVADLLIGPNGLATKFADGPVKPFVLHNPNKGYFSKKTFEKKIPFENTFLTFLNRGDQYLQYKRLESRQKIRSNYSVNIKGFPTDANPEAKIKPHATHLRVKCANRVFSLTNLNYPIQKTINWSPENCVEVAFTIEVDELSLVKKYLGNDAFPNFLKDFSAGTKTFYPMDFPQNLSGLNRLGITYIRVNYEFSNHEPLLTFQRINQKRPVLPNLPKNITQCWDN